MEKKSAIIPTANNEVIHLENMLGVNEPTGQVF